MKNNIALIVYVASVAAVLALSAWMASAIWNSDMPEWLKWLLLR